MQLGVEKIQMIKDLVINQEQARLEYTVDGTIVCGDKGCYNIEKLELYDLMLKVVKNWNANNPELPL